MYLYLKALHIIAVISWMAGMLYLPRLFVYHCAAEPGSEQSETFKVMERRLLKSIMMPAMIVDLAARHRAGAAGSLAGAVWLHAKLVLVLAMTILDGFFAPVGEDFAADRNRRIAEILSYYQ